MALPPSSIGSITVTPLIIPGWARPPVVTAATPTPVLSTDKTTAAATQALSTAVPLDPRDAETLYKEGAAKRDEALRISNRKDDDKNSNFVHAFYCFTNAAIKGHAHSMYSLGILYQYGRGTQKNDEKALECFINSAAHGNVDVMEHIGFCYQESIGTPEDLVEAYTWYRRFGWHSPTTNSGAKREMPDLPQIVDSAPGTKNYFIKSSLLYLNATYYLPIVWDNLLALFASKPQLFDIWVNDQELHDKMRSDLTIKSHELKGALKVLNEKVISYIKDKVSDIKIDEMNKDLITTYDLLKLVNSKNKQNNKT